MRNKLLTSILIGFAGLVIAQSVVYKKIEWDDLIPSGLAFEDPFEDMEPDVLGDLSFVARVRLMEEKKPSSVTEDLRQKTKEKTELLEYEGLDVDYLISIRYEIAEKRRKYSESVVKSLNNQNITIAGYLLPLEINNEVSSEFLLVPWVGACIHTPPPPKNQVILVKFPIGHKIKSIFEPVWVAGNIKVQNSTKNLYLKDGSEDIQSGYIIEAKGIKPY